MISLTPNGRRAEEFNALLEGADSAGRERDARLLEVVGALRATPEVEPRPAYAADLRERLMAEAEVVLSQVEVERKLSLPAGKQGRRDRRVAIAAGAIALVGVSSSVAFASQALPGDTLYPIKRAIEGASTSLTFDDASKGDRLLNNASGRLAEVEKLAQRSSTLRSSSATPRHLHQPVRRGCRPAARGLLQHRQQPRRREVAEFAGDSIEKLSALSSKLPAEALGALEDAVNSLTALDNLAHEICPGCSGGITELPRNLAQLTATDIPVVEVPEADTAPPASERTYTDEGAEEPPASDQQGSTQSDPTQPQPTTEPSEKPGKKSDKKNDQPQLKDATKGLTDLLVGDEGLLGEEGLVGGLLGGLLGPDGLLRGGSSDD